MTAAPSDAASPTDTATGMATGMATGTATGDVPSPTATASGVPTSTVTSTRQPAASGAPTRTAGTGGPPIVEAWIPYSQSRKDQMAAYAKRHYGVATSTLTPKVIVLHFTETDTWEPVRSTFVANVPNRGELPGVCAHFVVDQKGVIRALVPTNVMCRHAIGVNHVAIGIEIVQATHGHTSLWADQQILGRPAQIQAVLGLVRQLQTQFGIAAEDIVGHATANRHRLFLDKQGWRNDHTDWQAPSVAEFRSRL